jgi:hypothetical protein
MYIAGLSFVATVLLIFGLIIWGPGELIGFVATFSGDAMVIHSVESNTELAKGGLRAGDRVLMINDLPI